MNIKTSKGEFHVASWMLLFALIVVDNMYANHCKKKSVGELLKRAAESGKLNGES